MTQADSVIGFIEGFLTLGHSHLGQPFLLQDWQQDTIRDIYDETPEGRRKRRTYLLGLPRKNGKSQLGAALALYHLIADPFDDAPQVISAAGDRAQARLVFEEAQRMVRMSPELSKVCVVYRNEIRCKLNNGTYRAVSADAGLQQGLNPSFVVFDELHVFKNSELYEALTLGSATRNAPLTLVISTAGFDLDGPLGRLYSYGLRIAGHRLNGDAKPGELEDSAFGMTWYGPESGQTVDHSDPAVWERFNPAWSLIKPDEMAASCRTTHEAGFRRYRLNEWTSTETTWLPHGAWDSRATGERTLLEGERVVLGFDGAWKGDSTALVAVSLEDFHIEPLALWEAPTNDPDWRTPADEVEDRIRDAFAYFTVREVVADPWRFEQSLLKLMNEGLPIVEFPTNSIARMVPACQTFYEAVLDGTLTHNGDAALARHLSNCRTKEDARGVRITKEHPGSKRHIDLAVATVIAYQRARQWGEQEPKREPRLLTL